MRIERYLDRLDEMVELTMVLVRGTHAEAVEDQQRRDQARRESAEVAPPAPEPAAAKPAAPKPAKPAVTMRPAPQVKAQPPAKGRSVSADLEKLQSLLDMGVLTDEEFQNAKKRLLGQK